MTPQRYGSKPTECQAHQLTGKGDGIIDWSTELFGNTKPAPIYRVEGELFNLWVEKSQRWCDIMSGDYVVLEPDGTGFYPCAKKIFEERWEPINSLGLPTQSKT